MPTGAWRDSAAMILTDLLLSSVVAGYDTSGWFAQVATTTITSARRIRRRKYGANILRISSEKPIFYRGQLSQQ